MKHGPQNLPADGAVCRKLYEKYRKEMPAFTDLPLMSAEDFSGLVRSELGNDPFVTAGPEEDPDGVLFYSCRDNGGTADVSIPVIGLYYGSETVLHRLFTEAAERCVGEKPCTFHAYLYAGDETAIRYFNRAQFGMEYEQGYLRTDGLSEDKRSSFEVRLLAEGEIEKRWGEIWRLAGEIVRQLRVSPVFYKGEEFTEELYHDFFTEKGTSLFAACEKDGSLIGIIRTGPDDDLLSRTALMKTKNVNVGEIYVIPSCRGTGVSHDLLAAAAACERSRGNEYLWVGHGTANYFGRRYWDRYFRNYAVEMTRTI